MTRTCTKCGAAKATSDFPIDRSRKTGRSGRCKKCNLERVQSWTKQDPERAASLRNAAKKKRFKEGRVDRTKERYGVSRDRVLDMLEAQDDRCAICFQYGFAPHVDHNHASGALRELLCFKCNASIGMMEESLPRLRNAIKYLERHNG